MGDKRYRTYAAAQVLARFLLRALPRAGRELARWREMAARCPDPVLRQMALASIAAKKFHCQGGSVFAVRAGRFEREVARAIVALQTISDYLDNLCDRAGVQDGESFALLHRAFLDALCPGAPPGDYYALYPYRGDGGYLGALVRACQEALACLPGYGALQEKALSLARLYCSLQVRKHLPWPQRVKSLVEWLEPLLRRLAAGLYWWELAAATGSTLGIFALFSLAARGGSPAEAEQVLAGYFPWICGLHILLDYFIDQQEDAAGGDLNFVAYYRDGHEAAARLRHFACRSLELAARLPDAAFHQTVVAGLLAMYLSDPKAQGQEPSGAREELLASGGPYAGFLYRLCRGLRRAGVV
ncbi:tetraprenyl-beta-curcumene synthase family protein [Desulfovirgula thermocuniculi]|uniref:tetraprenyl-beta-curcumene synthase family protein n=1 Tax=Desulfovirgula thermocuniculi TaxID=348842 RepID=UPI0004169DCE|nr:tetraprenyl-beta-curcumene synthase family protein [Desulfovirgula thermocuniculi]